MQKISVIIPCYNVQLYVADCLNSLINQTHKDIEIICVNDGSTDNTGIILEQFKSKYPALISVLFVPNGGAPAARNIGLKNSTGNYIQFLDADDIIAADKFEKQLTGFEKNVDVVVSDRVHKNHDLTRTLNTYYFNEIENNPLETAVKRVITTCNPLYKKEVVTGLKGYDEQLKSAQDWDFHIRLVLADYKIKYVPGIYFTNRQVQGSVSSNWVKVSIQAATVIKQLKAPLLKSPWMNTSIKQYIAQLYMNTAIYCKDKDTFQSCIQELA